MSITRSEQTSETRIPVPYISATINRAAGEAPASGRSSAMSNRATSPRDSTVGNRAGRLDRTAAKSPSS